MFVSSLDNFSHVLSLCLQIRKTESKRVRIVQIYSNTVPNKKVSANQVKQEFADNNHFKNISFKGGVPNNLKKELPKVTAAIKAFSEDFGEAAGEHFREIIKKSGLKISDDAITFNKEQPFLKRALEIITYPVTGLPIDIANTAIGGIQKISWFKNSTWLSDLSAKPFLKHRREAVENKSNEAAIKHYFEILKEGEKSDIKRFVEGHTRIKPLIPNYNSESERSLTRIVTGLIPAFFLANDAYNLSMYMNNNKDLARKEKKRRFNQEVLRIGATSLLTYEILHLFSKQSNKYMGVAVGLISGITLISEIIGRSLTGTPILPLNEQKAKEIYADKRKKTNKNNLVENKSNKEKSSLLNTENILTTLAGLIAFGFTVEKVSNITTIKAKLEKLGKQYKNLFTEKYTIKRELFNELIYKLHENGFKKMAYYYRDVVKNQKGEIIELGTIENKKKQIIIHQILTFPVRFIWSAINLPYKVISRPIIKLLNKGVKQEKKLTETEMIQNSLRFLEKIKDDEKTEFAKKVNQRLVSSFDNLTKSSYSNADLSTATRITSNAVTSGFLIADSYNMVMVDSQGEDKDLAEGKAKERTLQRAVRIAYGAFITKITNDLFKGTYNSSLLGAQAVNVCNVLLTETLERKSVGLPLYEATQEEIKENEMLHLKATGTKGAFFRAMAKLTGKNSFSDRNNKNS